MALKALPKDSSKGEFYRARARCDFEEFFCTDDLEFRVETTNLVEAAKCAEIEFGYNYTLLSIERVI